MKAYVALHVRERPGGPAVVTPVPFVELAYEAASAAAATDGLLPTLKDRLQALEPIDRLPYADPPEATLLRVPIEIELGGKGGEAVEIAVGAVALTRIARGKPVLLGYVPVLPSFEVVARHGDLERFTTRLATRVAKRLESWSPAAVLNADEPDDSRLEVVELELDQGGNRDDWDEGGDSSEGILDELGIDLTRREGGHIDRRDELVGRVLETLSARDRSSVMLVGPPDVGKTALVHEIARRVAAGEAPAALRGRRVFRISANELIAGAQYTGQWQERARRLIDQARRTRAIVVMGDPVGIIDAGRWSQSDNNLSRYLRPYVESGDITLVCECTSEQLAAAQRTEPSFVGAFQRIDVVEPTPDEARAIAAAAAARLAETASVEIAADAVDAAVDLTQRFEPYRSFPGKAVRLLEDAVRERADGVTSLDRSTVTAAFARRTGMWLALLSDDVALRVAEVREHFQSRVLGQPEATGTVVDLVAVLKAGLNDPQKPLASLFFVGPTGVGKTELAKALAEFLFGSRERLVRFDMGQYASADAVQRLIGTAWGSSEGELTRRVREQPFCVVLLDEIEKAHWSVFDALLAAIGEGRLTDAAGRVADFRNAIVIMTSNLGATRVKSASVGFGSGAAADNGIHRRYVEEAEKFFRPEFFNRIDRIVVFHALTAQTVRQIARRELERLLVREGIVRRRLLVEVDDAVFDTVAATGFHPRYGARPLQREIERVVIQPLARLLVDRSLQSSDFVRVFVREGRIAVDVERVSEPEPRVARRERQATQDDAAFAKAERAAAAFVEQVAGDESSALADDVRAVASELVTTTHYPSFWDDAARARATLQRIYRLENVLDRFDALRERAAGLTEMARRVREARDRARLGEVPRAIEEMEDRLLVLRLELAAAAAGAESGAAVVRVVPVGSSAARWAGQLLAMYGAWADRTAREAMTRDGDMLALEIDGLATLDLLAGDSGLHRHVLPDRSEELARVIVEAPHAETPVVDEAGVVVRVYEEGRRRVVRDPRTGVRESHVAAVLEEGRIDAFLIAALRHAYAASTTA